MIGKISVLRPFWALLWFLGIRVMCPECGNIGGEYKSFGMMQYWHSCDTCLGGKK